ncbi:MAG: hypothetical protein RLZZ76_505 [Candidatus Parcubacteria bacterium]|jgi:uncharacterized membrane protein YdjX (TVP38/TMEM64 family)
MKRYSISFGLGLFVAGVVFFAIDHREFVFWIRDYIEGAHRFSQVAYVFLLFSIGTYLPLNAIPLIPFGAAVFGPFEAALLSSIGWTLGAIGAFLISRTYGRTYLEKHLPLARIDKVIELLPEKNRLPLLLVFRLVLPSDTASYALGLTKTLGFKEYSIATAISYTVYSFLLSYLGHALFEGNVFMAIKIGLVLLAIFSFGWYLLSRLRN